MTLLIGFLTFIIVLNCLFLILLILVQLPKKEAGAGLAFGGGASDALFGAGSGTALTRITRYLATTFLVLAVGLSILRSHRAGQLGGLEQELERRAVPAATSPLAPAPGITVPPQDTTPVPAPAPAPANGQAVEPVPAAPQP
jgi:preprotein translocase subunit SecG